MMSKNRAVSSRRCGWTLPALVLALGAMVVAAQAQDFPTRTVKIVVPFPAGGTADVMLAKSIKSDIAEEFARYGLR